MIGLGGSFFYFVLTPTPVRPRSLTGTASPPTTPRRQAGATARTAVAAITGMAIAALGVAYTPSTPSITAMVAGLLLRWLPE